MIGGTAPLKQRAAGQGQVSRDVGRHAQATGDAAIGERADLEDAARDSRRPSERAGRGQESPRTAASLEDRGDVRRRAGIRDERRQGVRCGTRAREREGAGRSRTAPGHGTGTIHDERAGAVTLKGRAEEADREETGRSGRTRPDVAKGRVVIDDQARGGGAGAAEAVGTVAKGGHGEDAGVDSRRAGVSIVRLGERQDAATVLGEVRRAADDLIERQGGRGVEGDGGGRGQGNGRGASETDVGEGQP